MLYYISKANKLQNHPGFDEIRTTFLRALLSNPRYSNLEDAESENVIGLTFADDDIRKLSAFPGLSSKEFRITKANHKLQFLASEKVTNLIRSSKYWKKDNDVKNRFFFPYQIAGIAFALARRGRAMILDPMGLGKTSQAVGTLIAGADVYLPAAIVCPLNAFPAWVNDVQSWSHLIPFVVSSNPEKQYSIPNAPSEWPSSLDKRVEYMCNRLKSNTWPDNWVIIINYEKLTAKTKNLNQDIVACLSLHLSTVIFDEAHNLRNPLSDRSQKARILAENIPHALLLTGTPVLNAPSEMWTLSKLVQPNMVLGSMPLWPREEVKGSIDERNSLFRHYLTEEMKLPNAKTVVTPANWVDYAEYTPEVIHSFSSHVKDQGVRRTRKLIASIPGAMGVLPDGTKLQLKKKNRRYVLVDLPESGNAALPFFQNYLNMRSAAFDVARKSKLKDAIVDQLLTLEYWFTDLVYDCLKVLTQNMPNDFWPTQSEYMRRKFFELYKQGVTLPRGLGAAIGMALIPAATEIYLKATRPIIFFTQNHDVAEALGQHLVSVDPSALILVTLGSGDAYIQQIDNKIKFTGSGSKFARVVEMFEDSSANTDQQKRVLILTPAGKEGLNLPSADNVVFLQRLASPGDELQAEDRINRPQQKNVPNATYLVVNDTLAKILFARAEIKRSSMLQSLNEALDDDFSNVMDIELPTDLIKNYSMITGDEINKMIQLGKGNDEIAERSRARRAQRGLQVYGMMRVEPKKAFAALLAEAQAAALQVAEAQKTEIVNVLPPTIYNVNLVNSRMMASNPMRDYLMSDDVPVYVADEKIDWNYFQDIPKADDWQPGYSQYQNKFSLVSLQNAIINVFGKNHTLTPMPFNFKETQVPRDRLLVLATSNFPNQVAKHWVKDKKLINGLYVGKFTMGHFFIASTPLSREVSFMPPVFVGNAASNISFSTIMLVSTGKNQFLTIGIDNMHKFLELWRMVKPS